MPVTDPNGPLAFTERQIEILEHLAAGRTDRATAARMRISERQVRREIAAMIAVTGAQGRIPLVLCMSKRSTPVSARGVASEALSEWGTDPNFATGPPATSAAVSARRQGRVSAGAHSCFINEEHLTETLEGAPK
jgi:DNA-binding CsgD family transcriptional regulator